MWEGETEDAAAKKMLNVAIVVMLYRDKTKGVWNHKANHKWDHGHQGCCSQCWISVLDNNDKSLSCRWEESIVSTSKFITNSEREVCSDGHAEIQGDLVAGDGGVRDNRSCN